MKLRQNQQKANLQGFFSLVASLDLINQSSSKSDNTNHSQDQA
jgi:hypothetical protein